MGERWRAYADYLDPVGGCKTGFLISPSHSILSSGIGVRAFHLNGNALYSLQDDFKEVLRDFFIWAATGYPGARDLSPREDRMSCDDSHCHGSFDTTLAEFLLTPSENAFYTLPKYQASSFMMNSPDRKHFNHCLTGDGGVIFIHKPWLIIHEELDETIFGDELDKLIAACGEHLKPVLLAVLLSFKSAGGFDNFLHNLPSS